MLRKLILVLSLVLCGATAAATGDLPGDSLYQLPIALVDQNGQGFALADRRGTPQLVSMFYTSCQYVCPLIIDTLKKTQRALPDAARARLQVLLISFDPDRDTPQRLSEVYAERQLDKNSWTLARTEPGNVRKLAAALDIQYRALANRDINHSSALVLLDSDGRIVARTDKIGEVDSDFITALKSALRER